MGAPGATERGTLLKHLVAAAAAATSAALHAQSPPPLPTSSHLQTLPHTRGNTPAAANGGSYNGPSNGDVGVGVGVGKGMGEELEAAVDHLVAQTAGLLPRDLCGLATDALAEALGRRMVGGLGAGAGRGAEGRKGAAGGSGKEAAAAEGGGSGESAAGGGAAAAAGGGGDGGGGGEEEEGALVGPGAPSRGPLEPDHLQCALDRVKARTAVEVRGAGWFVEVHGAGRLYM